MTAKWGMRCLTSRSQVVYDPVRHSCPLTDREERLSQSGDLRLTAVGLDESLVRSYYAMPDDEGLDVARLSPWLLRFELSFEAMEKECPSIGELSRQLSLEFGDQLHVVASDDNAETRVLRLRLLHEAAGGGNRARGGEGGGGCGSGDEAGTCSCGNDTSCGFPGHNEERELLLALEAYILSGMLFGWRSPWAQTPRVRLCPEMLSIVSVPAPAAPLLEAARRGDLPQLQAGIAASLPVDGRDERGHTPLHLAACHNRVGIIRALVEAGAPLDVRTGPRPFMVDEMTRGDAGAPLHCAARQGHLEAVYALLNRGALVNFFDNLSHTPLQVAAAAGRRSCVAALVYARAWLGVGSASCSTPRDYADDKGHTAVSALLRRAAGGRWRRMIRWARLARLAGFLRLWHARAVARLRGGHGSQGMLPGRRPPGSHPFLVPEGDAEEQERAAKARRVDDGAAEGSAAS